MDHSNYIIPFGKYQFTALCRIPASYLLGLYGDKDKMDKCPEIKQYIETNLSSLITNQGVKIATPSSQPICKKTPYGDEESAKKALKLIKHDKRNHKKPVRAYHCEMCKYWHLTSKQ